MAGETETFTILRGSGRDKYGDRVAGPVPELPLDGCQFAPGPSREVNYTAQQVTTDGTVYAPAGGPRVLPDDQLRREKTGEVFGVVGDPQDWGSAGVVILLKKISG